MVLEQLKDWAKRTGMPLAWGVFSAAFVASAYWAVLQLVLNTPFSSLVVDRWAIVVVLWVCISLSVGMLAMTGAMARRNSRISEELMHCSAKVMEFERKLGERTEDVTNLRSQLESAFRLAARYEEEAKQDLLSRLDLVLTGVLQQERWAGLGACINTVRVEQGAPMSGLTTELAIEQRAVIHINIGRSHNVKDRMIFFVLDKSDDCYYGTIRVVAVGEEASNCRLVNLGNEALWNGVKEAANSNEDILVGVAENKIVPDWPSRDIDRDTALAMQVLLRKLS